MLTVHDTRRRLRPQLAVDLGDLVSVSGEVVASRAASRRSW
jgi:hypothetical protein